eukprot:Em0005g654a
MDWENILQILDAPDLSRFRLVDIITSCTDDDQPGQPVRQGHKTHWLPVRLKEKVQTAWKQLSEETRGNYQLAMDAFQKWFEPSSKREHYVTEIHFRKRKSSEQWGDFADQLRCLADKAFSTLVGDTKEVLALDRYLSEIADLKIAFAVRQQRPETLQEAVTSTLQMESYAAIPDKGKEAKVSSTVVEDLNEHDSCNVCTQPGTNVPTSLDSIVKRSMEEAHGQRNASSAGKRAISPQAVPLVQEGGSRETERLSTANQVQKSVKEVQNVVHDLALQLMVDTGAAVSLLRREQWSRLGGAEKLKMEQWDGGRLVGVEGSPVEVNDVTVYKGMEVAVATRVEENHLAAIPSSGHSTYTEKQVEKPWEKKELLLKLVKECAEDLSEEERENEGEQVIAYASRVVSKQERKHSVTRRELLAVVTFTKYFRSYLLGRRFILRTDHSSLQWLYDFKELEGQTVRWLEQLQEFNFEVVHRSGHSHRNADALSWLKELEDKEDTSDVTTAPVVPEDSIQRLQ